MGEYKGAEVKETAMAQAETVILFSVDGMRADGLQTAKTPHVDELVRGGVSTFSAQTVMPSVTLPCHSSMFRSTPPTRHGIVTNTFTPLARPVPSIIDVVRQAQLKAAAFYNWEQLRDLASPGSLDHSLMMRNWQGPEGDRELAEAAGALIKRTADDPYAFIFVYLGHTDVTGHASGWMSEPYLAAISNADACVGIVLEAAREAGRMEQTAFIVTADHGGHGQTHGTDMPEDMTIPWVCFGPGVPSGKTVEEPVSIMDNPPTIAALLGLEPGEHWEGKPVPF